MKKLRRCIGCLLLVAALAPILGGCAYIAPPFGGGAMGSTGSNEEAWYVKNRYVLMFLVSSDIYYCDGKGACKKAQIR